MCVSSHLWFVKAGATTLDSVSCECERLGFEFIYVVVLLMSIWQAARLFVKIDSRTNALQEVYQKAPREVFPQNVFQRLETWCTVLSLHGFEYCGPGLLVLGGL